MRALVKTVYPICFVGILLIALAIRLLTLQGENFNFAGDQGRDALHVREILIRHHLPLLGPPTRIDGVFAGAGWYYTIAIGYDLFSGHPFGAVFIVILLHLLFMAIVIDKVRREVSPGASLVVGLGLLVSWEFYTYSRIAAQSYPLILLACWMVVLLTDVLDRKKKYYLACAILAGFGFHAEVAGATALALFYFSVGVWLVRRKILTFRSVLQSLGIVAIFFIPHLVFELQTNFSQTRRLVAEMLSTQSFLSGSAVESVTQRFLDIITTNTLPQSTLGGLALFVALVFLMLRRWKAAKKEYPFLAHFFLLTLVLFALSWVFFSGSLIWRYPQTIYLGPLLLVSILLSIFLLPRQVAYPLLLIVLLSQALNFQNKLAETVQRVANDPRNLKNQLAAIDWVYQQASGRGFSFENQLSPIYDYSYQYLFWWYGKTKYGYLPCSYASFPMVRELVVPGSEYYQKLQPLCPPKSLPATPTSSW